MEKTEDRTGHVQMIKKVFQKVQSKMAELEAELADWIHVMRADGCGLTTIQV